MQACQHCVIQAQICALSAQVTSLIAALAEAKKRAVSPCACAFDAKSGVVGSPVADAKSDGWEVATRKRSRRNARRLDGAAPPPVVKQVAGAFTLPAKLVPRELETSDEILQAVQTAELYFIEQWQHFAIRIGDLVLHAGLGEVFPNGHSAPRKIKPCHSAHAACSAAVCPFYHDPAAYGAPDVRNYAAQSWVYGGKGGRTVGSASTIERDVRTCSREQRQRFFDQVAHDLLVALVLHKYGRS